MPQNQEDDDQQAQLQEAYRRKAEEMQKEAQLRQMLRQAVEPAAYERMQNIRLSNPELYEQLVKVVMYMAQQSKGRKVSEDLLKQIVARILSQRKDSKISFARK